MPNNLKDIPDLIQRVLDKNRGFITVSKAAQLLPREVREQLGIKSSTSAKILMKKLEQVLEDRFIFRKKGIATYILTPCDPADLVRAELSEGKGIGVKTLAKRLKPFMYADIQAIVNDLIKAGEVKVLLDEKLEAQLFFAGSSRGIVEPVSASVGEVGQPEPQQSGEYTLAKFRAAYDDLHKFWAYPRIPDLRRKLGWPRDVFDEMIRTLRDNLTIQIEQADESLFTRDEILDCFVDENNYKMGIMIWNGR